jgi:hypothetical protein
MHGIEIVPKREVVVPEVNSLSVADRLLLNKNAKKALEAEEMGASRKDEYPLGEDDMYEEVEENMQAEQNAMEEEDDGEAEAEEEEEEAEEEAEEEEEVEEEEEEVELEEFEYKGATYYRDSNNTVFGQDEDGDLNTETPIGIWDAEKNRIRVYQNKI